MTATAVRYRRGVHDLRRGPRWAIAGVPVVFLLVLFVYPVVSITGMGLLGLGAGTRATTFAEIVGDAGIWGIVWFTVWQAVASTVLTVALGIPGAYVLSRLRFPGRRVVRAVATVPFVMPTVVVAAAFTGLLGSRGPLRGVLDALGVSGGRLTGTVWAVLIAHAFFNYAVVLRTVGGLWEHLDPRLEEAARTLGARGLTVFREVTWPLLRPAVASAAAIVFLFTFTSFGVVLLLGAPRLATIEVEIFRSTTQLLDLRTAAVLSLLQLVGVLAALGAYARLRRRRTGRQRLTSTRIAQRPPRTPAQWWMLVGNLTVMVVLLGLPLFVLVERSLATEAGYSLQWYRSLADDGGRSGILFVSPLTAVWTSLRYAVVATVVAVVVGACAAVTVTAGRNRWLDTLLMLPLGTSAVTVGFGFLVALDSPPLDLRNSLLLVPLAQALVAVPFVVRLLVPVVEAIDPRLREAAAVLGAPPGRVFREVDLPIVGRGLLAAAGFAFAVSLGEFGATVFLAQPNRPTVPVAIYRLLGQPGAANLGRAMAMSTVLMILTTAAILTIERLRVRGVGEF